MKFALVLALFTSFAHASNERELFRGLIEKLTAKEILCEETSILTPEGKMDVYTLQVNPADNDYKDAFFIQISREGHAFTTLIAYEGKNNYKLGELTVNAVGSTTTYEHAFNGVMTDITTVTVGDTGVKFWYTKMRQGQVVYDLKCKPVR